MLIFVELYTLIGLVKFSEGTEIIPAVAQSWHLEEDGVTWSFLIKKDVKFHSGREIKAGDFKHSIERVLTPEKKSPNTWLFEMIEGAKLFMEGTAHEISGIKILDNYRLSIKLIKPYHAFILNLAQVAASIVDGENHAIGAGLYKIKSLQKDSCLLEAFEDYYEGRPFVDEIEIVYQKENSGKSFLQGEIDLMTLNKDSYISLKDNTENKDTIQIENGYGTYYVGFNLKSQNPLVQNKTVRQALNYCLHKEALVAHVTDGLGVPAKGPVPPTILQDTELQGYPYNLTKAKTLLEDAGFKGNQKGKLKLCYFKNLGDNTYQLIAEEVKYQLSEIGIEVDIFPRDMGDLSENTFQDFDIFVFRWIGDTGDPDNFLQPMFNINNVTDFTRYHNPSVEEMLEEAVHIKNPNKRQKIYCKVQKQIVEDAPWIFLYHITNNYIFKPHLKGVKMHPIGFFRLGQIWLDK